MRAVYSAVVMLLLSIFTLATTDDTLAPSAIEKFGVFHDISYNEFVQRGELHVLNDGTAQYQPIGLQDPPRLTETDSKHPDPSKYTVILRSLNGGTQFVLPVMRCRLVNDLKAEETFVIHTTENGDIFHIDYDAGNSANCQKTHGAVSAPVHTKALLRKRVVGPAPKLNPAAVIDMDTGKEQQPEPPKSFLAKYWYYIVPVVIMLMLGGDDKQQEAAAPS
ncbi:hypothetical protein GGH12_005811 [Coemansia sp. RSA 1822]|nr:hypothetical protein LPJ76_005884 [Coemansia sp. RSA 638]KAJ2541610.1 hypothetical protein GGF49_003526 [Coemansia sp. RSA 1853]KAJ2558567.1 hypothetical protein GGH12_005811 [Coemansia sp. RSA 1822]KAJ2660049.1 hypothetical protein IW148_003980 [Coemansia sp. RSA 1199]